MHVCFQQDGHSSYFLVYTERNTQNGDFQFHESYIVSSLVFLTLLG